MNDTQKRIKAYKDALPGLRERVAGVALLLVMSLVMMTSASFAWLTLSRAPEVAGTATTVTANGNLELALSDIDGEEPEESAVGDSSKSQSVLLANLTWGNLVNLSDPAYGLDHLQLRPAMLGDTTDLLNTPLASVNFGQDGRVQEGYNYDLNFTNWNAEEEYFEYSAGEKRYGVRAISTIEYVIQNATFEKYRTLVQTANSQNAAARSAYRAIMGSDAGAKDTPNVKAIAGLMGDYMTYRLNGYNMSELDITSYVDELYSMVNDFSGAYDLAGNALAGLINIQIFLNKGVATYEQYTYANGDAMWLHDTNGNKTGLNWTQLNELDVQLTALKQYESDVLKLQRDMATLSNHYNPETQEVRGAYNAETETYASKVYWTDIETVVLDLVDIPSCTVAASETETGTAISGLGKQAATGLLGKDIYAVIHKGVIKNFEDITGEQINLAGVKVKATYMVTLEMTAASIKTAAYGTTPIYQTDRDTYCTFESGGDNSSLLQGSAQNTYGMAVDMWVRTNADNSYLVLEGNVSVETYDVPATLTLSSGEVVDLYSATITYPKEESTDETSPGEDDTLGDMLGNKETVDVYYLTTKDENDNEVRFWYFADTHGQVYKTDADGNVTTTPNRGESISISSNQKIDTNYNVIGYEGENRVWQENSLLTVNSTTQGNGSCYVFYADNPTDQQNSLKLLSNLRVAFLNSEGDIMAMAKLDTEKPYEDSGKVTVPLVLTSSANAVYTADGNLAIAALEQNEATWMTMIVYLEGTELTNDQVLAANEIQGKLNVQFGSSVGLQTMGDEALETAEMYVSASVDKTSFDYATDDDMTVNVTVTVDGEEANTVTASFIRKINASQGSQEDPIVFQPNGDGTWSGSYTFNSPGEYELRWVQVDGQDYELTTKPAVSITGLNYEVFCTVNNAVLTGSRTYTTDSGALKVKINTDDQDKMPRSVQLQFLNDETGDPVTALMSYDASSAFWTGSATFTASGSYTLTYLIMDGQYTELASGEKKVVNLTLGVSVRVRDDVDNPSFEYEPEGHKIGMLVDIVNEAGDVLANLQGARLYYGKQGSALEENGLNTDLTWDADKQCYTGAFLLKKTGVYKFNYVSVAGNNITNTTNIPPVYTMLDPDPPSFVSDQTKAYQLINNNNSATMEFILRNTSSAQVLATVKNLTTGSSQEIDVTSSVRETELENGDYYYSYSVTLPALDTETGVDGEWQLTQIRLSGVYDDKQVYYYGAAANMEGAEDDLYMVWNLTDNETAAGTQITDPNGDKVTDITTEVQTPKLSVSGHTEYLTGKTFQSAYTNQNAITLTVTDAFGNALKDTVKLGSAVAKYTYALGTDKNTTADTAYTEGKLSVVGQAYQYTYGTDTSGNETVTKSNLTVSGDLVEVTYGAGHDESYIRAEDGGDVYVNYTIPTNVNGVYTLAANTIALNYAGKYECTSITVEIGGNTYDFTTANAGQMPKYAVQTNLPVVKVSSISPTPGTTKRIYTVKQPTSANQLVTGDFFRKSDYYAGVYIYTNTSGGTYDQEAAHTYAPSVTLNVSGLPTTGYEGATMTFVTPNADSLNSTFSFTNGFSATTTVGKAVDGEESWTGVSTWPESYPAGKMTQNKVTATYSGNDYTFVLDNAITIDQPQSPAVLIFTGIPATYTAEKPAQVVGEGTTVTAYLPKLTWTAHTEEPDGDADWTDYGNPVTMDQYQVYTVNAYTTGSGSRWNPTRYHQDYQYYNWTRFESSCTDVINFCTEPMQITKWKINGVEYAAGQTITIEVNGTITAEAQASSAGTKEIVDTQETTTYRYLYGYVAEDSIVQTTLYGSNYYLGSDYSTAAGNAWSGASAYSPTGAIRNSAPVLADPSTEANMTEDSDGYLTYSPADS